MAKLTEKEKIEKARIAKAIAKAKRDEKITALFSMTKKNGERKYSTTEIATKFGIHPSTVSRIYNKKAKSV